jgi:hypothetical protein
LDAENPLTEEPLTLNDARLLFVDFGAVAVIVRLLGVPLILTVPISFEPTISENSTFVEVPALKLAVGLKVTFTICFVPEMFELVLNAPVVLLNCKITIDEVTCSYWLIVKYVESNFILAVSPARVSDGVTENVKTTSLPTTTELFPVIAELIDAALTFIGLRSVTTNTPINIKIFFIFITPIQPIYGLF